MERDFERETVDNDRETEEETEKLCMKALLRDKELFTSRPIQRDIVARLCGRLYIHNHSTLTESNAL